MSSVKSAIELAEEQRHEAITHALKQPVSRPTHGNSEKIPTVWAQADTMVRVLADVSNHCRRTANNLEQALMELERMLGNMPKRP